MLCGVEILCSVVAVVARVLGRALMTICSPKFSTAGLIGSPTTAWGGGGAKTKVHVESEKQQLPPPPSPPALVLPAFKRNCTDQEQRAPATSTKAARGRPPRLVIPAAAPVAVARGGVDPFGGRETDVATETEVKGEGFCLASRRGVRHAMEDGYGVITHHKIEGGSQLAFYGVYDGHGGRAAVDFVADKLGKNVVAAAAAATTMSRHQAAGSSSPSQQRREEEDDVTAAIRAAYLTTDSEFLSQGVRGGACAATALVKDGELYVSNVGDCRAVLGSRGGVATALTSDHTPGREDERLRIESTGGYVSCGGSGVWRVQDSLAVSRAFGDAGVKQWVTCEPETARVSLTADGDCRFLVLASDGLWCKVSNQEAVDAVAAAAAAGGGSGVHVAGSTDPCKELVAMARSRGSRDDITVMVVDLQPFLPV
uniref:protein-serine/threonine phosphatase n=1 Tax=Oryza meridionalis TaxID=40149 RepID=A0A0E0DG94_9ORYZ